LRGDRSESDKHDQLCLADDVMYNVMDEETTTSLWSRLETLLLWVISYGINPRITIMKMGKANLRRTNTNTKIYVKNPKSKNHGEREIPL